MKGILAGLIGCLIGTAIYICFAGLISGCNALTEKQARVGPNVRVELQEIEHKGHTYLSFTSASGGSPAITHSWSCKCMDDLKEVRWHPPVEKDGIL